MASTAANAGTEALMETEPETTSSSAASAASRASAASSIAFLPSESMLTAAVPGTLMGPR